MEMFKPELALLWQGGNTYTLAATTITPHSGYSVGAARIGTPAGMVHIPRAIPVTLELTHRTGAFLPVATAVTFSVPQLELGDGAEKTGVVAYAVLDGKILGFNGVSPDQMGANLPMAEDESSPILGFKDWHAVQDRRGGNARLFLSGGVTMRGVGYRASLRDGDMGLTSQTMVCILELTPPEGDPPLPGLQDVFVNFETESIKDLLKEVVVMVSGDPVLHIPVQTIDIAEP